MKLPGCPFPSDLIFFGQTTNWKESFLEECFLLQYHLRMSYSEVKKLPVRYRRWFLDRLAEEFKNQADVREKVQRRTSSRERSEISDLPFGEMNSQSHQIREKKFK